MSLLLWAFVIAGAVAIAASFIIHWLDRMHRRARYVGTPAWQREHWQEERERAKFAQRRTRGELVSGDHLKVGLGLGHDRILTRIERLQAQKPLEGESLIERKVVSISSAKPPAQRSH
jgi:hypothetical protein